eukprot:GHUV01028108.1.p1 GENE.GHUV01028108.1~~GHUV01028108.1.p1  ORF type:complete len:143 (+),score=30.96 GHUV01028108.1:339-767(+)
MQPLYSTNFVFAGSCGILHSVHHLGPGSCFHFCCWCGTLSVVALLLAHLLHQPVTKAVPDCAPRRALSAAQTADLVVVVGSSLMVWSAFRLVKAAKEAGAKLAIVNVGPTRADDMADLKVEALAGEVMMQLAMHPNLLLPRI